VEHRVLSLTLLGIGAMRSPRFAPAGLLLEWPEHRVMIDGGPGAAPTGPLDAWLVTDIHSELIAAIRRLGRELGVVPKVSTAEAGEVRIEPRPVTHTSHAAYGYLIGAGNRTAVWAPEFWEFPGWASGADLVFADAAGWRSPIRFAHGTGGHAAVLPTAVVAKDRGVRRLVYAHVGRPTIRALDAGEAPSFGEFGIEGATYRLDY
jgi:hypothetical protein